MGDAARRWRRGLAARRARVERRARRAARRRSRSCCTRTTSGSRRRRRSRCAVRRRTPDPARSAGPSRRCGGERPPATASGDLRATYPPAMRRALRALSTVLIVAGALMIADAGVTLAWQEPVSALIARDRAGPACPASSTGSSARVRRRVQRRVLAALATEGRRIEFLAREARRTAKTGGPIGRIAIPKIGADFVVVQGTDTASLRKGPGHYPDDGLPGPRRDGRDRRPPHDLPRAVPPRRRAEARRRDRADDALRPLRPTRSQRTQIVTPDAKWIDARRRLRAARAVGLPPALQRRPAHHRLRAAAAGDAARRGGRGRLEGPWGPAAATLVAVRPMLRTCAHAGNGYPRYQPRRLARTTSRMRVPQLVPSGTSGKVVAGTAWTTRTPQ